MSKVHEMHVYRNDKPDRLTVFLGFKADLNKFSTEPVQVIQLGPHAVLRIDRLYEKLLIGSEFFFDSGDAMQAMRKIVQQELDRWQYKLDELDAALEKLKKIKEEDKNGGNTTES